MPEDTKYIVNQSQLTAIGTAIREKLNEQTTYTVDEMPGKIEDISGGGSSDISVSEVTLVSSNGQNYRANITLSTGEEPDYCTGVQIDEYGYDTVNPVVDVTGEPQTLNFIIMPNKYIFAMCKSVSDFIITGNAEVATATQGGVTYKYVKIYGTCSITLVP